MNILQILFAEFQETKLKQTQTSDETIRSQMLLLINNDTLAQSFFDSLKTTLLSEQDGTEIKEYALEALQHFLYYACLLGKWDLLQYILQNSAGLPLTPSIEDRIVQEGIVIQPSDPNLIKGIELLQILGAKSLKYCVNAFAVSEYLSVLGDEAQSNPEVAKFIAILTEVQARRELALTWSISGKTAIENHSFDLEGSTRRLEIKNWLAFCQEISKHHKKAFENVLLESANSELSAQNVTTIVDRTFEDIFAIDPLTATNIDKDQDPEDINLSNLGFGNIGIGHAVAIASWNDMLCYVNRDGRSEPGIQVFRVTEAQKERANEYLNAGAEIVDFETQILAKLNKIYSLPMKRQKAGNCVWIAAKSTIWQAIFFNTLKIIKEQNIPAEDPVRLAANLATAGYKFFSAENRSLVIKKYLALDTGYEKDHALLAAVLAKIKKPQWQERGFSKFLPQFNHEQTQAQATIIEEHLSILGRMPQIDDLLAAIESRNVAAITQYCSIPNAAEIFDRNFTGRSPLASAIVFLANSHYSDESEEYERILDLLFAANIRSYNEEEKPLELANRFLKYSPLPNDRKDEIRKHIEEIQNQLLHTRPTY